MNGFNVLVVDDEQEIRDVIEIYLFDIEADGDLFKVTVSLDVAE